MYETLSLIFYIYHFLSFYLPQSSEEDTFMAQLYTGKLRLRGVN